ncbi:hypothetical protein AB0D49_23150 [Streptomyces sp. NPDC048290]|uniref:MoaF-related domain-containing protein n=1 Tax=Streptomyces sp. NPDC048290 TaxID=3155811 RepID=UPI0034462187
MSGTATPFALAGKVYRVEYGALTVEHDYTTEGRLTYTMVSGNGSGYSYTADIEVVALRGEMFAVSFQDEFARLVMVIDAVGGCVDTFMVAADGGLQHLRGTLTPVAAAPEGP